MLGALTKNRYPQFKMGCVFRLLREYLSPLPSLLQSIPYHNARASDQRTSPYGFAHHAPKRFADPSHSCPSLR